MKIIRSLEELRSWRKKLAPDKSLGFVPTMGALHEGHLSLVHQSQKQCSSTVVSIFVNPLQFSPQEDFSHYPRPFEQDCALLEHEGIDLVFAPDAAQFYAPDASTYVLEETVSQPLCGSFRPGHFRGVTTVVLKLFHLVQPDFSYFGQKDAQQCAVLERMVRDLNVQVQIVKCPTVREPDGLALSSRNIYLNPLEREKAPLIYQSLKAAVDAYTQGERSVRLLEKLGRSILEKEPLFKIQYWEIRHPITLAPLDKTDPLATVGPEGALIAVAAYLRKTRLIDNWVLNEESLRKSK